MFKYVKYVELSMTLFNLRKIVREIEISSTLMQKFDYVDL